MHRQVGDLNMDDSRHAYRGLLIRHLVMPGCLEDSETVLKFISSKLSKDTYVNIMSQYHPCYEAYNDDTINRRISSEEYHSAIDIAKKNGLYRGF